MRVPSAFSRAWVSRRSGRPTTCTESWPRATWRSLTARAEYQAGRLARFAAVSDGRLTLGVAIGYRPDELALDYTRAMMAFLIDAWPLPERARVAVAPVAKFTTPEPR